MYYHSIAVLLQTILLLFLLTQAKLLGREMYAIDKKTWSLLCRVASSLMRKILKQSGLNGYLLQNTGFLPKHFDLFYLRGKYGLRLI